METNCTFWDELAIQSYKSLLKKNPNNANIYRNLGIVYMRSGRISRAMTYFKKSIKCDKNIVEVYYHLGKAYLLCNDQKNAIKYFNKYAKIKEKNNDNKHIVSDLLNNLSK